MVMQQERPDRLVSIPEAAKLLGLSELLTRKAVEDNQIPSVRIGSRRWIPVRALDQALEGPFDMFPEKSE